MKWRRTKVVHLGPSRIDDTVRVAADDMISLVFLPRQRHRQQRRVLLHLGWDDEILAEQFDPSLTTVRILWMRKQLDVLVSFKGRLVESVQYRSNALSISIAKVWTGYITGERTVEGQYHGASQLSRPYPWLRRR